MANHARHSTVVRNCAGACIVQNSKFCTAHARPSTPQHSTAQSPTPNMHAPAHTPYRVCAVRCIGGCAACGAVLKAGKRETEGKPYISQNIQVSGRQHGENGVAQ